MYPGARGGRGAGRGGFSLRGVPPQLMKPGRGGGPFRGGAGGAGYRPAAPPPSGSWRSMAVQPLFPPGGYRGGYGASPRTPIRGARGSPRGRGMGPRTPMGMSGSRGGRGRGRGQTSSRGRGRGAGTSSGRGAKSSTSTTPSKQTTSPPSAGKNQNKNKSEREKDALVMTRPWVTEAMCAEIRKKHELQDISFKTKSDEDFNNFKEQRTKVTNMLRAAKMEYIGSQDETDIEKIMAVAKKNSRELPPVAKAGSSLQAEGDSATTTTATNGTVDKTQNGNGHTPAACDQPAVA